MATKEMQKKESGAESIKHAQISDTEVLEIATHLKTIKLQTFETINSGNIHRTILLTYVDGTQFVLQGLNQSVFACPNTVVKNMAMVTQALEGSDLPRLEVEPWNNGDLLFVDDKNRYWRALRYWENIEVHIIPPTTEHAYNGARKHAEFLAWLSNKKLEGLPEVIEGYRNISYYERTLEEHIRNCVLQDVAEYPRIIAILNTLQKKSFHASMFKQAIDDGLILRRCIHKDAKYANIAFLQGTDSAYGTLDCDTTGMGNIITDLGDLLRSGCNPAGSTPASLDEVHIDMHMLVAITHGFLEPIDGMLTDEERIYTTKALLLNCYEHALRYTKDQLDGGKTFGVDPENPLKSLQKAETYVQLMKLADIQLDEIRRKVFAA